MAPKATLFKAELNISDMDRGYYQTHSLTIDLPLETCQTLAGLTQRTLQLQGTIQDGQVWLSDDNVMVQIDRQRLK
jgi:uncharacterized protein YaeQ